MTVSGLDQKGIPQFVADWSAKNFLSEGWLWVDWTKKVFHSLTVSGLDQKGIPQFVADWSAKNFLNGESNPGLQGENLVS